MLTSAEIKIRSKEIVKERFKEMLLPVIVYLVLMGISNGINANENVSVTITLVPFLIIPFTSYLIVKLALSAINNKEITFLSLLPNLRTYFKMMGIILLIGISVLFGTLLLIIPGIIFGFMFILSDYLLVDDNEIGVFESLSNSSKMMKGYKFDWFIFELSFILWHLLGMITLGLAYIWIMPYYSVSKAIFFLEIKNNYEQNKIV